MPEKLEKNQFEQERAQLKQKVISYNKKISALRNEIKKVIIGQEHEIDSVLKCLLVNGHALLEGNPGLAKTLLVRALSMTISNSTFNRIQFTPDLLPADIIGLMIYNPEKGFYVEKGPVFANFILADEINRAPPKVQSALLESMQERMVSIGKETFDLPKPFLVLATQNPLEQMGVYPLPEAQVDRFLFKVWVDYPVPEEELDIIDTNIETMTMEDYNIKQILGPKEIIEMQHLVKQIYISEKIKKYIVDIVNATRYPKKYGIPSGKYIQWGGSPRASIYLSVAAKSNAFMNNRVFVIPEDIKGIAMEVLRHRIILNYEGKAAEIKTDEIINDILDKIPVP
ncbi:MAG TPA: MoxR family ATPase [Candidatus Atribacteria bacterium]|nr:MoxR family ATPase [Candidatus Atribacteria bacterium]